MQKRRQELSTMTVVILIALLMLTGSIFAEDAQASDENDDESAPPASPAAPDLSDLNERLRASWGIEVVGLRLAAGKQMLDFRYRIVDAQKAEPLTKEDKPYLIDTATGQKLPVPAPPKVGPLRSSGQRPVEGRVYFMIFANPGGMVKSGSGVTVVIGEARIEGLVVQ